MYIHSPSLNGSIDLIDKSHTWQPFGQTTVVQNIDNLIIAAGIDKDEKIYYRAYLQTEIKLVDRPLLLSMEYEVETKIGEASYSIEIKDMRNNNILFNSLLNSTTANATTQTFILPRDLVNKPLEFRIYIVLKILDSIP